MFQLCSLMHSFAGTKSPVFCVKPVLFQEPSPSSPPKCKRQRLLLWLFFSRESTFIAYELKLEMSLWPSPYGSCEDRSDHSESQLGLAEKQLQRDSDKS